MTYKLNLFLRQLAWALIWIVSYPEMFSFENWKGGSTTFLTGAAMYLISGFVLELVYRRVAWGFWFHKKQYPAVVRPECPDHPWISTLDGYPTPGVLVEVFCADGKERSGRAYEREDGGNGLGVLFEHSELEMAKSPDGWRLRPTHWRYPKDGSNDSVQN